MVTLFEDDDAGYLRWISEHPNGYVVNMRRSVDPNYLVLHRASCFSINRYPNMDEDPGGFTERAYRKLCSTSLSALEDYLRRAIGDPHELGMVQKHPNEASGAEVFGSTPTHRGSGQFVTSREIDRPR